MRKRRSSRVLTPSMVQLGQMASQITCFQCSLRSQMGVVRRQLRCCGSSTPAADQNIKAFQRMWTTSTIMSPMAPLLGIVPPRLTCRYVSAFSSQQYFGGPQFLGLWPHHSGFQTFFRTQRCSLTDPALEPIRYSSLPRVCPHTDPCICRPPSSNLTRRVRSHVSWPQCRRPSRSTRLLQHRLRSDSLHASAPRHPGSPFYLLWT